MIFPRDRIGRLWEQAAGGWTGTGFTTVWPKSLEEICGSVGNTPAKAQADPILRQLRHECQEKARILPLAATLELGAYPVGKHYPLSKPFEIFNPGWESARMDPETARRWTDLSPVFMGEVQHAFGRTAFVYFRLGLRRDLVAWHGDPAGLTLPLSDKEVDLNEPSLGYFHLEGDILALTVGRFPVHWSPSPDFGVTLTDAVPRHDAAQLTLKTPWIRYHLLLSSLDPWLEGTPVGDTSGVDFPAGSEEWRQRHYPGGLLGNAHRRVYDARIKTLAAHRLEADLGPLELGITESEVLGGKVPDLQDINPFAFYHNNFNDGYANVALALDAKLGLPYGLSALGEVVMDDVKYEPTETGSGTPSILGFMAGLRHGFATGGWVFLHGLHFVQTDPYLYNYLQPLNRMTSRQIFSTNMQEPGDRAFVDKLVVDYPMGYIRGGDARDWWYRMEASRGSTLSFSLTLARLEKGEVDTFTPFENYFRNNLSTPSGLGEEETRVEAAGTWRWRHGLRFRGGLAWQGLVNQGHLPGKDANRFQVAAGVRWILPE